MSISKIKGLPTNVADVKALKKRASEIVLELNALAGPVNKRVNVELEVRNAAYARAKAEGGSPKYLAELADMNAKAIRELRKQLLSEKSEERKALLQELHTIEQASTAAKAFLTNPRQVLTASDFTPRRAQIFAEAASMGDAALRNLASQAATKGDKEMAAALLSIVDKMPTDKRPFSTIDLAEAVVGEACAECEEGIRAVRVYFNDAMATNRQLEGLPPLGQSRIANALDAKPIPTRTAGAEPNREGESHRPSLDKIASGLATRS